MNWSDLGVFRLSSQAQAIDLSDSETSLRATQAVQAHCRGLAVRYGEYSSDSKVLW